jgi:Ca-activated chloride channel family protein
LNYQFQYPQAFWLLLLLPFFGLVFFFYKAWRAKATKRAGDARLLRELFKTHSPVKSAIKFGLLLFAFACGCIALANPRKAQPSGELRKGIDVVIALDVSASMLAKDLSPDRLTKAKQFISRFIDQLQDDRTSLILFAGYGYIRTPLTFDKGSTKMFVSVADAGTVNQQGTNISDALNKSLLVFGEQTERFRTVILITDGETHNDDAMETARGLAEKGIMVNTVGIGSEAGATLIDSAGNVKEDQGQVVISKLNEQVLKQVAAATNGTYIRLGSTDDAVEALMAQFSEIDKKALGDTSTFTYQPFYAWLAVPMVLLLVLEIFLPDRKKSVS